MKTAFTILLLAFALCGCEKPATKTAAIPFAEFTNSYADEMNQRMALAEVGWWSAQAAAAGNKGSTLYSTTNDVAQDFKAMMFNREHPAK